MATLALYGGTVVTMNHSREVLDRATVLVEDGFIREVLPEPGTVAGSTSSTFPRADVTVDARGKVIIPGLIQGHVHLCQTLFRGQADDLELLDWLRTRIWPLEAAHDADSVYWSAMLGIAELLKGGTTAVLDMQTVRHADAGFQAILDSGIRAVSGKVMMDLGSDVPRDLLESAEASVAESVSLMQKWHGRAGGRIGYAFSPRFAVSCSETLLREAVAAARAKGARLHTHASETRAEVELVRAQRGASNVSYLERLGFLGSDVTLAHCIWLDEAELAALRASGTCVAHCPTSNLKLGSGVARVPEMMSMGIPVCLGSDGAPCNNRLDSFLEMRQAALIHKTRLGPAAMPASRVFEMATRGGAIALGLEDEVGSIEPGKRADLVVLDLETPTCLPKGGADVLSRIVYSASAENVVTTVVDGRVLVDGRRLTFADESEIAARAEEAAARVRARAGLAA